VNFPIYVHAALCLSLQRECLTKSSNTHAFSRVMFIIAIDGIGLVIESDHVL